jgi:LPS-assembly protein
VDKFCPSDTDQRRRLIVNPSVSYPITRNYGYVTPKFSFNYRHYVFGENNTQGLEDITQGIPTASLDSGLYFDRTMTLGGKQYTQTLEPRAFYVYTPFHDQSQIPNFSTSEMDFGFAQISRRTLSLAEIVSPMLTKSP